MKTALRTLLLIAAFTLTAGNLLAGPSRPVQSSTFAFQIPCGPAHDPTALQGQWFLGQDGSTNVNVREYHDEDHARSIYGVVQNIQFSDPANPNSNIMAFDILAVVSNTLPSSFQAGSASNSHNEVQNVAGVTPGGDTMTDVRIVAEFALVNQGVTPGGQPPYWADPFSQGQYHIVAVNQHEHAWYCWAPGQQLPQYQPSGAYQVPAWNLTPSTIPPGGTAAVLMQFIVTGTGLPNGGGGLGSDYRHSVLRYSQATGEDVLYNRTPSLKISHWLDTIVCDNGVTLTTPPSPYWDGEPIEYVHASDASVFFNDINVGENLDWGDAPDAAMTTPTFNTLAANNGANHTIFTGIYMGAAIDAEPDGLPTVPADGDDLAGVPDDEDGVSFQSHLIPGQQAKLAVTVSVPGQLDVWLDADLSSDWTGPNDQVYSGPVNAGLNTLMVPIPQGTAAGPNYMRFRFNTGGALPFYGGAADGEVEDYAVDIESLDWGDAPVGFNTLAANNGASHTLTTGISMGPTIDAELDGQPTPAAKGDDLAAVADEDGVTFLTPIIPGQPAQFGVMVSAVGWVDVWLDTDLSGSWTSPDYIWAGAVAAGANTITIPIPYQTLPGQSYMRFRYNVAGASLPPSGWGADGEVEDYLVVVKEPDLDFGDAPDGPYPTLLGNNGAFHIISAGVMLGGAIDAEPDGQPTLTADGDDAAGSDDEDGVTFIGKMVAGSNGAITVTAGTAGGKLDAWIDFGGDGSWIGDHLWGGTSKTLAAGSNTLTFPVPQPSALGPTVARFRISSGGSLPPDNSVISTPDGEVEDYMVDLYQPSPTNLVITNLTFTASNTVATIEWTIETGILYQMQITTNLMVSNSWTDVEAAVLGPFNSQTNNMLAETNLFYRITAPWTP